MTEQISINNKSTFFGHKGFLFCEKFLRCLAVGVRRVIFDAEKFNVVDSESSASAILLHDEEDLIAAFLELNPLTPPVFEVSLGSNCMPYTVTQRVDTYRQFRLTAFGQEIAEVEVGIFSEEHRSTGQNLIHVDGLSCHRYQDAVS